MKDILHYSMLQAYPQIIVNNIKDANVNGGFADSTVGVFIDFNSIEWNDITGATLTTKNGSDAVVTSGNVGIHGRTDIPINNPDASTHNNDCYVTLPSGDYVMELDMNSYANEFQGTGATFELYDKSNNSVLNYLLKSGASINQALNFGCRFSLSSQTQVCIRFFRATGNVDNIVDLGDSSSQNTATKSNFNNLAFTKIG